MEEMAFEVKNVSKRYGRDAWALRNVSLSLPEGCVMGLVGENGAGKTTLIRLLLGTLTRSGGDIRDCIGKLPLLLPGSSVFLP